MRDERLYLVVAPETDADKCTGCGDCVELCPTRAVELVKGKGVIVRPQDCDYCTECEAYCPVGAIRCPFQIVLADVAPFLQEPRP